MMRTWLLSLTLCSTLCAAEEVKLEPQQQKALGIETMSPASIEIQRTIAANAQVLDPAPLIGAIADLRAAQVTAQASKSELERLERLHADDNNVSLKAVEAARAQATADGGKAAALRAQLGTTFGRAFASLDEQQRNSLVNGLNEGRLSLLRAEVTEPVAANFEPRDAIVHSLSGDDRWPAAVIGRASQANDRGVGAAFLLRVAADLQPNRVFTAELKDRTQSRRGIKIPRSAIVRWQASDWIFIESESNVFERRMVHPLQWLDDGCLIAEQLEPDQKLVSVGAMMLLGMEGHASESGAKED